MSQALTLPTPLTPPTPDGDTTVDAILPELVKVGGAAAVLYLLALSLIKEWIVVGPAHRREVADLTAQRDRSDARNERLIEINATQSEALRDFARGENLGVRSLEAIKQTVAEKSGGDA
jgi:hypothetical protein